MFLDPLGGDPLGTCRSMFFWASRPSAFILRVRFVGKKLHMQELGVKFFPTGRGRRGSSMGAAVDRRVTPPPRFQPLRGGRHPWTGLCSVSATASRGTPAICWPTLCPNSPDSAISERVREAGGRTGNVHFRGATWPLFGLSGAGVSCAKTYRRGTAISTRTFDIRAACETKGVIRDTGGVAPGGGESGALRCESGTLRKLACLWNVSWMF